MSERERERIINMLLMFIIAPPDNEYQEGFLGAVLTIGNEILGIPSDNPIWEQASEIA
jgi:hypothetical protein